MIPIENKFKYPKLERLDSPDGRRYVTPEGPLPSVTTILSATKDMAGLKAWREWVGDKKADQIVKTACDVGTLLHTYLENHLLGKEQSSKKNMIHIIANKMAEVIIEKGLKDLDCVYGMESALYLKGLYAGTADLIASYKGTIAICDFKNSLKIKKEEYLEDYKMQLVAYGMAHDSMFGTNIDKGVIFMAARPVGNFIDYKTFILEGDEYQKYKSKWIDRLDQYYNLV